jgi:membrane protein implicated in regulation of membrane protease activity
MMPILQGLASGWWWLGAGLLLATAEIMLPGVFLIWLGAAALLTGVLSLALPLPIGIEFAIFAIAAIASVFAGRRWFAANPIASTEPLLNERMVRMVGETVIVTDPITGGRGRARVGDGEWIVEGPSAERGTRVRVTQVRGSILVVEPAPRID